MVFNLLIMVLGYLTFGFIVSGIIWDTCKAIKKFFANRIDEAVKASIERGENHE